MRNTFDSLRFSLSCSFLNIERCLNGVVKEAFEDLGWPLRILSVDSVGKQALNSRSAGDKECGFFPEHWKISENVGIYCTMSDM